MLQYKVAPIIQTDRLYIRIVADYDANDFYEFCSDPKVCTYLTFSPYKSVSFTKYIINNMINAYINGTDVNFSIILKDSKKVIGSISLSFKKNINEAEVGYLLNSKYWNNKYMDEALKAIINIAYEYYNVDVISASYILDNFASKKLLENNGFIVNEIVKDGFEKNNIKYDLVKCYRYK